MRHQNFWARTAPAQTMDEISGSSCSVHSTEKLRLDIYILGYDAYSFVYTVFYGHYCIIFCSSASV